MTNHRQDAKFPNLPLKTKIWYGVGYLPDSLLNNAYALLIFIVYDGELRLGAAAIGLVGMIIRLWDAFNDPLIGNFSDHTRTRWGRRRPYVVAGAVTGALCTLLLWNPPTGWSSSSLWWYVLVVAFLYYTAFSLYSVPYFALGLEMSPAQRDRDSVMGWRVAANNIVLCALPFVPMLIFSGVLGANALESLARFSVVLAFLILGLGLLAAWMLPEPLELPVAASKAPGLWDGLKCALRNGPFLQATGIVSLALLALVVWSSMVYYMNLAFVYPVGDLAARKADATRLMALTGFCGAFAGFALAPFVGNMAARIGRKPLLYAALALMVVSLILSPWLFRPDFPAIQVVFHVLFVAGITFVFVLTAPMVGEVCDLDEIEEGTRREGLFSAFFSLGFKISIAIALFAGGVLISASGFSFDTQGQSAATLGQLKLSFVALPILCLVGAFLLVRSYPLNAEVIARHRLARQSASA